MQLQNKLGTVREKQKTRDEWVVCKPWVRLSAIQGRVCRLQYGLGITAGEECRENFHIGKEGSLYWGCVSHTIWGMYFCRYCRTSFWMVELCRKWDSFPIINLIPWYFPSLNKSNIKSLTKRKVIMKSFPLFFLGYSIVKLLSRNCCSLWIFRHKERFLHSSSWTVQSCLPREKLQRSRERDNEPLPYLPEFSLSLEIQFIQYLFCFFPLAHENILKRLFLLVENSIFPLLFSCSSEECNAVTLYSYSSFSWHSS